MEDQEPNSSRRGFRLTGFQTRDEIPVSGQWFAGT